MEFLKVFHDHFSDLDRDLPSRADAKHVLIVLGMEGPRIIHSLKHKIDSSKLALRGISEGYSSLHYEQAKRAVEELKRLGLVKEVSPMASRRIHYFYLTFDGLFWYLKYSGDRSKIRERIKDALAGCSPQVKKKQRLSKRECMVMAPRYPLPFCFRWNELAGKVGVEKCLGALEETINNFLVSGTKHVEVKPIGVSFEVVSCFSLPRKLSQKQGFYLNRNPDLAAYLATKEAEPLRNAYLAHLFSKDAEALSTLDSEEIESKIPSLKTVTELAFLKGTEPSAANISTFLRRLNPKYLKREHYFTGMFVDNLLWEKEPFDNYCYEI